MMSLAQSFLFELQAEASNTRKLLSAITDDMLSYKPDHKSWSTADLAAHIAESYYWYVPTFQQDEIDFATYHYDKGDTSNIAAILTTFEQNLKQAEACLQAVKDDAFFAATYTIKVNGAITGAMPRLAVVRSMLMNHLYHHRGQLSIYLRACGKKVPGIYGPSQDEQ